MYLAIGAICKNERPYIDEWVAWNRVQGADHLFIADNGSTDGSYERLLELQSAGILTVETMPEHPVQFKAYNYILKNHGHKTKWLAFIDFDEFLFSPLGNLQTILPRYEKYAGVAARWVFFGSNGHVIKEPGLVIERFTKRAADPDRHIKSIVQPKRVYKVGNDPHVFRTRRRKIVDEHERPMPKEYAITYENKSADILRINHYKCKSKEEAYYRWTVCKDSGTGKQRDYERDFPRHDFNEVEDLTAASFADRVKKEIESWQL